MQAQPGDKLTVAGPRGSLVVPEDYAYQLYVCDESGMPALRRRLETLSKLAVKPQVSALVSVRDNACQDISRTLMVLISNGWHMMSRR
ncbi:siderophore-interacting protein [Escherichia coli]|uniref:Siderophore-interacting protein n=1 Tax=Escherichia coli TaxID=562 RepID=A0A376WSG5_ECOLX|nr:siderophore-interacting protein [Escherichia coli]